MTGKPASATARPMPTDQPVRPADLSRGAPGWLAFGWFFASSSAFQASRLALNLFAAAILAPEDFAVWGLVTVLLSYTTNGNLGILSGANREIPRLLGAGNEDGAEEVERVAFAGALVAGAALAIGAVVLAMVIVPGAWAVAVACGLLLLAQQSYLFYQVSLRGRLAFNEASAQQAVLSITLPLVAVPALLNFGVLGLILSQGIAYGVGASLAAGMWRRRLRPRLDVRRMKVLVAIGLPVMLSGLAFAAATTIDRWVIAVAGKAQDLGHYSLASTISASMMFASLVVAQQFYPRLALAFGRSGCSPELRALALRQSLIAVAVMAPISAAIVIAAPLLLPTFFSRYVEATTALQVLGLGYLLLGVASGFTNMLVAIGRSWELLLVQLVTAALGAMLSWAALATGWGLTGVALGTCASFALLTGASVVLAWRSSRG